MLNNRAILVMAALLVLAAMALAAAASGAVDQRGVLGGTVLANGLVAPGMNVKEGDVLVVVDAITGPVPAVRANVDGRVTEVLVKPGDVIRTGDVLVRIEPVHK